MIHFPPLHGPSRPLQLPCRVLYIKKISVSQSICYAIPAHQAPPEREGERGRERQGERGRERQGERGRERERWGGGREGERDMGSVQS